MGSPQVGLERWQSTLGGLAQAGKLPSALPWKPKAVSFGWIASKRSQFLAGDQRVFVDALGQWHVDISGGCQNSYDLSFVARATRRQVFPLGRAQWGKDGETFRRTGERHARAVPAPGADRKAEWFHLRAGCGRRDCPECRANAARKFRRKLEAEIGETIAAFGTVLLVTLTVSPMTLTKFNAQALKMARAELARPGRLPDCYGPRLPPNPPKVLLAVMLRRAFRAEFQKMKKRLKWAAGEDGPRIRFADVLEYGEKNGRLHMHVIVCAAPGVVLTEEDIRLEWRDVPPDARARRKARGGYRELDVSRYIEFAKQGRWDALAGAIAKARIRFAPHGSVHVRLVGDTAADAKKSARYLAKYVSKGGFARGPNWFGRDAGARKFLAMIRDMSRQVRGLPDRRGSLFRDHQGQTSDGANGDFGAWVRWCQEQKPDHPLWMPRGPTYRAYEVRAAGVTAIRERIAGVPASSPGGEDDGLEATFDALPVARGPPPGDECPF